MHKGKKDRLICAGYNLCNFRIYRKDPKFLADRSIQTEQSKVRLLVSNRFDQGLQLLFHPRIGVRIIQWCNRTNRGGLERGLCEGEVKQRPAVLAACAE